MKIIAYTDGATYETNPGPAGIGVALIDGGKYATIQEAGRDTVWELLRPIGWASNNVAEYKAVIAAIEGFFLECPGEDDDPEWSLEIRTDSALIANQTNGVFATRNPDLQPLRAVVRGLFDAVREAGGTVEIGYIPRELNKFADKLSKEAASLSLEWGKE
jgi:ribonuclease HI